MEHPKRISEITTVIVQRDIVGAGDLKLAIMGTVQIAFCYLQGVRAWIEEIKFADTRCNELCPSSAAASKVEADRVGCEFPPRKDIEIVIKHPPQLVLRERCLIKTRPFVTKSGDNFF